MKNFILLILLIPSLLFAQNTQHTVDVIKFRESSSLPSVCSDGKVRLDAADGNLKKCKTNAWEAIGGAAGGVKSWLTGSDADFEASIGSWVTYKDTAQATPVDGTGGTSTLTLSQETSTQLAGIGSLKIAKPASNVQGEGLSVDFTIDKFQQGKEQDVPFQFRTGAGYVNNFYRIFVFDITNAKVLNVLTSGSDGSIPNSIDNGSGFTGRFVPASDSISYRLIVHSTSTDAIAFDLFLDEIKPRPKSFVNVPVITPWESFTPTGSWTNTDYTGRKRRNGDSLEIQIRLDLTGTPVQTGGLLSVDIPDNGVIDDAKMPGAASFNSILNSSAHFNNTGTNFILGHVHRNSPTSVRFLPETSANSVNLTVPFTWVSGDILTASYTVPIVGFDSGAILSTTQVNDQTLKIDSERTGSQSLATGTFTTITGWTAGNDPFNSFNITTGIFTAPFKGSFLLNWQIRFDSNATGGRLLRVSEGDVRGSSSSGNSVTSTTVNQTKVFNMEEGETLTLQGFQTSGGNLNMSNAQLDIIHLPDFSFFGVTGIFEVISSSASAFNLNTAGYASGEFAQQTGNSVTLPPGSWLIDGQVATVDSGSDPTWTSVNWSFDGANGDNTTTIPTLLSTLGTVVGDREGILQTGVSTTFPQVGTNNIVFTNTSTVTVFLNFKAFFTVTGDAQLFASILAVRIQ